VTTPEPAYAEMPTPGTTPSYPKDWMGIVALIAPLVGFAIAGIVLGHLGLKANNEGTANNRGLTIAGLVLSYVFTATGAVIALAYFVLIAATVTSGNA